MDFHPILEKGDEPSPGLWYVISSPNPPSPRVGQACTCSRSSEDDGSHLYILGGADPSTTYKQVYKFDVKRFSWSLIEPAGLIERYEHSAMSSTIDTNKIYLFGGADQTQNLNSVEVFDKVDKTCEVVECAEGRLPKARTSHCSVATDGERMYVWGGGHRGSEPVTDLSLHIFHVKSSSWTRHRLEGDVPCARHGHVIELMTDSKFWLHGGMSGTSLHDDLYCFDLNNYNCKRVKAGGRVPGGRAAHSVCSYKSHFYIFGGLTVDGASSDLYRYHTDTNLWELMRFDSPPPTPRLDHSIVITTLKCKKRQACTQQVGNSSNNSEVNPQQQANNEEGTNDQQAATTRTTERQEADDKQPNIIAVDLWEGASGGDASAMLQQINIQDDGVQDEQASFNGGEESDGNEESVPVMIVFGGMDTSGNIYNDLLVTRVDSFATTPV